MANYILKEITKPIKDDLVKFQIEFESALQSDVKLINTVSKYIIQRIFKALERFKIRAKTRH